MELLTAAFRRTCAGWYERLPVDKRRAIDAWIIANPLPPEAPHYDRIPYAYCMAPGEIDRWYICKIEAEDVDDAWIAARGPLANALPAGAWQSQFRESELQEIPS
jgi:hypothetical protein